jgi:tetratricopeptide (TPR) repeat protein
VHIPWGEVGSASFVPEAVSDAPRPWRWNSVAVPLLLVIAFGAVIVVARPEWTGRVFGLLMALSLPAMAIALWNYPALIESFDGELQDRALLRAVFRQHSEHMLSAGTSNRLAALESKATREESFNQERPLLLPLRFVTYGAWLVPLAMVGTVVTSRGKWLRRSTMAGAWIAVGLLLSTATTWPRWLSEYHFARAAALENAHRFAEARKSLEAAKSALPSVGSTWRFWLAAGRLSYRQNEAENEFKTFFVTHQAVLSGGLDRARALLEPDVAGGDGSMPQRSLLAGIIGQQAAEYVSDAKYSAAEVSWSEAAATAPWKPAYQIARGAARLAAAPQLASEAEQHLLPLLGVLGDRMVTSDLHSLVGDAYFVAGDFRRARAMYDRAMSLFHLPKYININAQEGRLGM